MSLTTLLINEALNEGAQIWVLPDREHSNWCVALDWYLQFQISRASLRTSVQLSQNLQDLALTAEVAPPSIPSSRRISNLPLLIHSENLLPNRQTLHLTYKGNLREWLKQIEKVWTNLQEPSLRIFLPKGVELSTVTRDLQFDMWRVSSLVQDVRLWT